MTNEKQEAQVAEYGLMVVWVAVQLGKLADELTHDDIYTPFMTKTIRCARRFRDECSARSIKLGMKIML